MTALLNVVASAQTVEVEKHLCEQLVGIAFDLDASRGEGARSFELLINMAARLLPQIALIPLGDAPDPLAMMALARTINPNIEILSGSKRRPAVTLVIGRHQTPRGWNPVYMGSQGWVARISREAPVGSGTSANPFGAAAAACLGLANAFRVVFKAFLPQPELDDAIALSILDHRIDSVAGSRTVLPAVKLKALHLVGIGAIGSGVIWTLARLPTLSGSIDLVDHEAVELSNLQRYVLTDQQSVNRQKVAVAKGHLSRRGLTVRAHLCNWSDYLIGRDDWDIERVAVAVDTARDRIAIQSSLPKHVFNSWTQQGDLGVSRHSFVGAGACLACLYLPGTKSINEDETVAVALGLNDDLMEVRRRLHMRVPTERAYLEKVATGLGVPVDQILSFENMSLRELYVGAICGMARLGRSAAAPGVDVPLPFQSVMAGILLASEIVADALGLARPKETRTAVDLLRRLPRSVLQQRIRDTTSNCLCQDADYLATWKMKWGDAKRATP